MWWVVGVATSSAFFWPRNLPISEARERQPFGPCMRAHLAGAAVISFVCLWNVFHTPSHGPCYCVLHRWLGRVGMVASFVGLGFALVTAWWERYSEDTQGLAIGLSVVGCLQLYHTVAVELRDRGFFKAESGTQSVSLAHVSTKSLAFHM